METHTDDFHEPEPHKATPKSVIAAVLNRVSELGTSLLSLLSGLLAAALILYSSYVLYDTFYTSESARSSWDLLQYKPEIIDNNPKPLSGENLLTTINSQYRAWLTIEDTNIDYPMVQGENDLYYASHDIYGNVSLTGAIYLAAGNNGDLSDSYNIVYGHHMDNGAMFGALDAYTDETYYNSHREGIIVSRSAVFELYAFAVVKTDAYQSRIYSVGDRMEEVIDFISTADGTGDTTTLFYDPVTADEATKVVALSTCAAANTNGRLVVFFAAKQRNLITVEAQGYEGTYDALPHSLTYTTNYPDDTVVEFSTDGGVTWSAQTPSIKDAGEVEVQIRVTNDTYGRATTSVTLKVNPAPVTVRATDSEKVYGETDPSFAATVEGVLDNATIAYTVTRPGAGTDENVGSYPDAIVPSGDERQGNYTVTFVPADFTIHSARTMVLSVTGYEGVYDAESHPVSAVPSVPEGTTIEYSTDGGNTWTTEVPAIRNVGTVDILVRATNPNYETVTASTTLTVTPKAVTVSANPASKVYGTDDPRFSGTVSGTVDDFRIVYTVTRPGAGTDEDVNTYDDAIVPSGEQTQGNYTVTFIPTDFEITPADTLTLEATGYDGAYDAQAHAVEATVNVPAGTVIEYSTDDGATWTTTPPSITNVGTVTVQVRATNRNYDTVTETVTLNVTPAPVVVTANASNKVFGEEDPQFTAGVSGVIDGFEIVYTVTRPDAGTDEAVGEYPEAIVASGEATQGNYSVTYVNADFTIASAQGLALYAEGYTGIYDGTAHPVVASATTPDGGDASQTVIEYSTDGGRTWSTTVPTITNVGNVTVQVRASNPDFAPVEATVTLHIDPRTVVVTVNNVSKLAGNPDPEWSVTIEGLLDGDTVDYTVSRDEGEEPGSYALTPMGAAVQGNYRVLYNPGMLRIINNPNPTPVGPIDEPGDDDDDIDEIDDPEPPLAAVTRIFRPRGIKGRPAWALVNLICLILTFYVLIPLLHLRQKYSRARMMKKINKAKAQLREAQEMAEEEARDKERIEQLAIEARQDKEQSEIGKNAGKGVAEAIKAVRDMAGDIQEKEFDEGVELLYYRLRSFLRKFRIGILLEAVFAVIALIVFILTEDMRLPMILIDQYTPVMIILLLIVWLFDVTLIRYRKEVLAEKEEAIREQAEREAAEAAAKAEAPVNA